MRIDVVGLGVTGGVTLELLGRLGHDLHVYDQDPAAQERFFSQGYRPVGNDIAPVTFLCVPEWEVESALQHLPSTSLPVVRSTTPPGTIAQLQEESGRHICHVPEFLRESTALWDALSADHIIIGACCQEHGQTIEEIFRPMAWVAVVTDTTTSETIKLVTNAYLSTMITFWNEISLITSKLGVNSTAVGRAAILDKRVSPYGAVMHGRPFAGRCLPKDLNALIRLSEQVGHDPVVLKAVRLLNEQMEQEQRERLVSLDSQLASSHRDGAS